MLQILDLFPNLVFLFFINFQKCKKEKAWMHIKIFSFPKVGNWLLSWLKLRKLWNSYRKTIFSPWTSKFNTKNKPNKKKKKKIGNWRRHPSNYYINATTSVATQTEFLGSCKRRGTAAAEKVKQNSCGFWLESLLLDLTVWKFLIWTWEKKIQYFDALVYKATYSL